MKVQVVYFSPTGTTKRILKGVIEGLKPDIANYANLAKCQPHKIIEKGSDAPDLVLLGVPTYASRIPPEASELLKKLRGDKVPAVLVAVYGNNKFGDVLLEMKDIAKSAGMIPVAAAAFIGEHSFSTDEMPIAHERPDIADIKKARSFGFGIRRELMSDDANFADFNLDVPGDSPYRTWNKLPIDPPETDAELCIKCGKCRAACPVDAICLCDTINTDSDLCIFCSACIKVCPVSARDFRDQRLTDIRERLHTNCSTRKEPEFFFEEEN